MNRPRGATIGSPVFGFQQFQRGDKVTIRDAFGKEHRRLADRGPVWGHDFAVVWVQSGDRSVPWPLEDVRSGWGARPAPAVDARQTPAAPTDLENPK